MPRKRGYVFNARERVDQKTAERLTARLFLYLKTGACYERPYNSFLIDITIKIPLRFLPFVTPLQHNEKQKSTAKKLLLKSFKVLKTDFILSLAHCWGYAEN